MTDKVKIEKNTVQETLIIPLYGKAWAVKNYPELFHDTDCRKIMDKLDYDFSVLEAQAAGIKGKIGSLSAATRQYALVWEIRDYLKSHPKAVVVNMGCGLDTAGHQADNGTCRFVNIDFPNVCEIRESLVPKNDGEINISSDLKDYSWMDRIDFKEEDVHRVYQAGQTFWAFVPYYGSVCGQDRHVTARCDRF